MMIRIIWNQMIRWKKKNNYKWAVGTGDETKEDIVIPEEDLLEQAEPEVRRLILKRDLRKRHCKNGSSCQNAGGF